MLQRKCLDYKTIPYGKEWKSSPSIRKEDTLPTNRIAGWKWNIEENLRGIDLIQSEQN